MRKKYFIIQPSTVCGIAEPSGIVSFAVTNEIMAVNMLFIIFTKARCEESVGSNAGMDDTPPTSFTSVSLYAASILLFKAFDKPSQ